jgi:S-adenosylmethionine synthetase
MSSRRNIVVYAAEGSQADAAVEMCEHKGVGHPDTVTDAVCEAVAQELVCTYEREFGGGMHFNVDKGLLVGGRSEPRFGGGQVLDRPKLIVCGRASNPERRLDLAQLVVSAAGRWLDATLEAGSSLFRLSSEVKEGSANLKQVFGRTAVRANDTSFGVGYAPLSPLEKKVIALAEMLGAPTLRKQVPAAGQDFKVMGLRNGRDFTFTVAIALIDRHVSSPVEYFTAKDRIRAFLRTSIEAQDCIVINQLDNPDAEDERDIYLTVTGLSAEMGDDGQVGRGNRVNGLITPGRPMSLEAAAGKNPYAHVGKIYNVLAHRIARAICEEVPGVSEATVRLLSTVGGRLDEPQVAAVEIRGQTSESIRSRVRALVDAQFDSLDTMLAELAGGRLRVY